MSVQGLSAVATLSEGTTLAAAASTLTRQALEAAWPYLPGADRKSLRGTCLSGRLQHDRLCSSLRLTLDAPNSLEGDVPAPHPEELEAAVAGRLERSKATLSALVVRLKGSDDLVVELGDEVAEEFAGEPEQAEAEAKLQRAAAELQTRRM